MATIDTNLFVGTCPFRDVPADPEALRLLRTAAALDGAIATGFDSVFYHDPEAGLTRDLERFEPLADWLRFYAVINPEFPRLDEQVAAAARDPRIVGLRLFPTLHRYRLSGDRSRAIRPVRIA